ncbi:MAG: hypothetical protein ACYDDO_13145 [Acidiferrobacterales bacterium]
MKLNRAGVDVAKSVFQAHAVDRHDQPRWKAKLRRSEWLNALSEHLAPGALVSFVMEVKERFADRPWGDTWGRD